MKMVFFKIMFMMFFLSGISFSAFSDEPEKVKGVIYVSVKASTDGTPIAGAIVLLYRADGDNWVKKGEVRTDGTGQALFRDLDVGAEYEVRVSAEGYSDQFHSYGKLRESEFAVFQLTESTGTSMNFLERCSYILYFLKED